MVLLRHIVYVGSANRCLLSYLHNLIVIFVLREKEMKKKGYIATEIQTIRQTEREINNLRKRKKEGKIEKGKKKRDGVGELEGKRKRKR